MTRRDPADDRTLQDDRAELAADPGDGSALTEGEGAPLAQDDAATANAPVTTQVMLGGAPIAVSTDDLRSASPGSGMAAAEDRDIGD